MCLGTILRCEGKAGALPFHFFNGSPFLARPGTTYEGVIQSIVAVGNHAGDAVLRMQGDFINWKHIEQPTARRILCRLEA